MFNLIYQFVSVSTIFLLDFETILTVQYFCYFELTWIIQNGMSEKSTFLPFFSNYVTTLVLDKEYIVWNTVRTKFDTYVFMYLI